jgi:CheY-like chemotaxis protein
LARKILLADDSVTAQNMGRKILADAGYEVIAVNNGSAALKKIAELRPDLAILDVYMPGYSGLEVCQRLKESPETARIPVLLSVGKLEPFKPDEAQRVRAEGYIVKPFEASELLSALAKLEDKIVPRAEPSKPGRFAKAIAAVEENSRSKSEAPTQEGAWKERIGFPQEKAAAEEKFADDSAIYNPMNRDLRTVVGTPAEREAEKIPKNNLESESVQPCASAVEASVDIAALAAEGLPKDVTPEEIAAIAAAAAQIQMAAALRAPTPEAIENQPPVGAWPSESAASTSHSVDSQEAEPVTMAATAEALPSSGGASRWTAVSVALEGDESALSLEQEMQKAYAASPAAEPQAIQIQAEAPEAQAPAEFAAAAAEVATEASATPIAQVAEVQLVPDPSPVNVEPVQPPADFVPSQPEGVTVSASTSVDSVVAEAASLEHPAVSQEQNQATSSEHVAESTLAEITPAVAIAENDAVAENPEQTDEPRFANLAAEPAAPAYVDAQQVAQPQASVESEASPAPIISSAAFAPIIRDAEARADTKLDPASVKSTAAAWASWRRIRDNGKSNEAPEANAEVEAKTEVPAPAPPDTAAMAVAAGAEQLLPEASSPVSTSDSADVASIVESVLADLRPKLMEEISRKMAQKK